MTVFITKGDDPLSVRQATKRGIRILHKELTVAGCRPGDQDVFMSVAHADLPQRLVETLSNLPGSPTTYAEYATQWESDNITNAINNQFNHQLKAYRDALTRLDKYELEFGQEEITEEQPTGEYDENGEPITETVVVQQYVAPFEPLTIEQNVYDEEGNVVGTETVDHPAIVKDREERASAQATVDATPQEVKDFVRNNGYS